MWSVLIRKSLSIQPNDAAFLVAMISVCITVGVAIRFIIALVTVLLRV